jgi:crotonobetaine/carnitine-CoA ligase
MIETPEDLTLGKAFFQAVQRYQSNSLLAVPANPARPYLPEGIEISYDAAGEAVRGLMDSYASAGYGPGHRIGLLLENRPEHMLHKLAMNALGACCVPLNPDHRAGETAYVVDHAQLDLVIVLDERSSQLQAALAEAAHRPRVATLESSSSALPAAPSRPTAAGATAASPASILYTSGTTGRPKGCVLSNRYELAVGTWYATRGGLAHVREGGERLYNPLPLFHVNSSILSFACMMLTGNCQVQTDRFQPSRWWAEVRESRATIIHYLGIIVSLLLKQPVSDRDRAHAVRFGFGAGVEPQLHAEFEARFGFPLIELWGMTEMVKPFTDNLPPRQVGTRAFGRSLPGSEARVADDDCNELPIDTPGELVIRHSEATPRKDFFLGYLDDEAATEAAWRGGWFHTGDIVSRDATGMLHFVDRRKNIIRRSGENIAAAEVEALLLSHPLVQQTAVLAVPDEVREEEVLACVVLNPTDMASKDVARMLFDFCYASLAYYKAPGWLWITDSIPTTATQKVQKHAIFGSDVDPRQLDGIIDMRDLKKRSAF